MGLNMFVAVPTSGVTANFNALSDSWLKESAYPRQISRIGFAGGTSDDDLRIRIYFGDRLVADVVPTTNGNVKPSDDDMLAVAGGEVCPAGVEMRIVPTKSATDTPVYGVIETKELISYR